jgi:hypothetical protein
MRKLLTITILALATAAVAVASGTAGSQQAPNAKLWLCHKTGATFTANGGTFRKFVAIRVPTRAHMRAHMAHGDVPVNFGATPPTTLKAQRQAAKTFCAAQRVAAPITPLRGGVPLDATLSAAGVTADLTVRTQVGLRRLCFTLDVTPLSGATVQITSLTLSQGSTTITFPASQLTGTDPSGCTTLANRALAKQLLKGTFTATLNGTVTPSGGSPTPFEATGTVSR